MGLCKCPKKKVTNLFCFEHRVNVCEHCLVSNHAKCIVRSYLQWLQDSDYDPTCPLCGKNLSADEAECARLICYDVFHWACLDAYSRQLPANTAPAGYTCPTCKAGIFPPANMVSPVAESLRGYLNRVNWARTGLGLPLIEETASSVPNVSTPSKSEVPSTTTYNPGAQVYGQHNSPAVHQNSQNTVNPSTTATHSVLSMNVDMSAYTRTADPGLGGSARKLFDTRQDDDYMNMSHDHDEDKYKRRPAMQWFARWFKSRTGQQKKDPRASFKRFIAVLVIGVIGFLTVIVIFSRMGRAASEDDPFLDPMNNPQIRVAGQ